jgi:GNAT superfamily N-acetyltransferase
MTRITVRDAHRADLPVLKQLFNAFEAWLNTLDEEPSEVDPARADTLESLAFGAQRLCDVLVAEDGGEIVGYLIYYFGVWVGSEIAPCVHIADLFVRETHQRRGIGRAMMEHARKIARERGARNVFWTVWRKNPLGQEFYRRIGAEPFEEEILMRWKLPTA